MACRDVFIRKCSQNTQTTTNGLNRVIIKSFTVGLLPLNKTIMLIFAKCRLVPSISGVLRSAIHYSLYFIVLFSNSSHATRAPFWSLLVSAKIVNPSHRKFVFYSKQETESLYLLKIQAFQLTPIFSIESSSVLVFLPWCCPVQVYAKFLKYYLYKSCWIVYTVKYCRSRLKFEKGLDYNVFACYQESEQLFYTLKVTFLRAHKTIRLEELYFDKAKRSCKRVCFY